MYNQLFLLVGLVISGKKLFAVVITFQVFDCHYNCSTKGTVSINMLESNPTLADGVLTACVGEQISLTCTHDITAVNTQWFVSPPVNCSASVGHAPPASEPCGPFTFDGITQVVVGVTALESTAMATADVSMTGSVVKCRSGNILMSTFVGNASLCIVGKLNVLIIIIYYHDTC